MKPTIDFERFAQFKYGIISLVGSDGFPWSYPTNFQLTPSREILLTKPTHSVPLIGKRVGVLFNHIAAIPTGGYTERRYMLIWGTLSENFGKLRLHPDSMSEWDEKILPFPELCARAAPQGQKYLQNLQHQVEL